MKDKIFRFAMSFVGNRADAEDIVQDIYERLWRRRTQIDRCENLDAFVMSSVRNICIDRLRRTKLKAAKENDMYMTGEKEIQASADSFDLQRVVDEIVTLLPQTQQAIYHLRDVEGYDFDTIARIVDMDSATVRVNLSRARQKIKESLLKTMNYGVQ